MKKVVVYSVMFIMACAVFLYLHCLYEQSDEYLAIIASVASILGIVISMLEIVGVKSKTEATAAAMDEARKDIGKFLGFSELKETSQIIDEIEAYLRARNHEVALVKLKELKDKLCATKGFIQSHELDDELKKKLNNNITSLGVDVKNLHRTILSQSPLDDAIVIQNLEAAKELLAEIIGTLKSEKL